MSVTGFRIDGSIQRYDYNALDNKPSTGLTDAVKAAILQIARKVVYIDEHGPEYYQELYDVLYGNVVSVRNVLFGCYSSNSETFIRTGESYTATIQANPGYSMTDATVSITMGGTNVTGAYLNGMISIPNVTGDIVITVSAVSAISSISATYTQSGVIYTDDTLDDLEDDLVVTATYNTGSVQTLTSADYTLSGTLTMGTSMIVVSYADKTTTFDVEVTMAPNGLVDGTYIAVDGSGKSPGTTATVSGNTIQGVDLVTYKYLNIPLQKEISLKTGDVVKFANIATRPETTANNGVTITFNGGTYGISISDTMAPWRNPGWPETATITANFTATSIRIDTSTRLNNAAYKITLQMTVNGVVVF